MKKMQSISAGNGRSEKPGDSYRPHVVDLSGIRKDAGHKLVLERYGMKVSHPVCGMGKGVRQGCGRWNLRWNGRDF